MGAGFRPYDRDLEKSLRDWSGIVEAQLNSQVQSVGAVLDSADTITLTNPIHHVAGTNQITTIIAPDGFTGPVCLIADGAWITNTTGNISGAFVAAPGFYYSFVFDGSMWSPRG